MNRFARTRPGRLGLRVLSLFTLVTLAGCALDNSAPPQPAAKPYAGAQAKFARPAIAAKPHLVLSVAQVAGHKVQVTDEDGPFWINLSRNHAVTAGVGNQLKVSDGRWWVDKAGLLCLKSSAWWKQGTCFELFGTHQFTDATVIHSLNKDNGPNTYYPFTVIGPAN
jgi:hypothetical protein